MTMDTMRILLVEDDPVYRELLQGNLSDSGYEVIAVESGAEAWPIIAQMGSRLGVVLLDRQLPDMDSLSLVARLKARHDLALLPVIMQTAMNTPEEVAEGLRAGVHYYLTKPYRPEALLTILRAAMRDRREHQRLEESVREGEDFMHHIDYVEAWFRTPAEARRLASFAARIYPDPAHVVLGLSELMLNAVEHGNLGIGYDKKTELLTQGRLEEEIARRLEMPDLGKRRGHLSVRRLPDAAECIIRDEGSGFAWESFLELSPDRAYHSHGRGIAMAKSLSFDSIEYRGCGNTVVARVRA